MSDKPAQQTLQQVKKRGAPLLLTEVWTDFQQPTTTICISRLIEKRVFEVHARQNFGKIR